ncbi:MAG: M67 family metallopeptidase [Gammaproteobacteria bacterium]|nr:M67 family metallopeptidase [Gammaproteobacteria bacterium]
MSVIKLSRVLVNQLLTHAQSSPEQEICGLVSARDGVANHSYPIKNSATDPGRIFEMAPQQQIDAMRQMREQGDELFAIYHSHPHASAEPSLADIQQSAYPDTCYLIISLDIEGVLEMRAWQLRDDGVVAVDIAV